MKAGNDGGSWTVLFVLLLVVIGAGLCHMADQVVFVRPPTHLLEKMVSLPALGIFILTGDRMLSVGSSALLGIGLLLLAGTVIWKTLSRRFIEPLRIRRFIEMKRRQKHWLNRLDDDTL